MFVLYPIGMSWYFSLLDWSGFTDDAKFIGFQNYVEAIKTAPIKKIEAIDVGRRTIHDEGATILRDLLNDKLEINMDTSRRIFTLIIHIPRPKSVLAIVGFQPCTTLILYGFSTYLWALSRIFTCADFTQRSVFMMFL